MKLTKALQWTAVAAATALAVSACGGSAPKPNPSTAAKDGGTFRMGIVEPVAIDPDNSQESEGNLVTENLFTGLTSVSVDGKISNALAESRTPNVDCSQWTFKIKGGTTFSNGEPVDAAAFVRGWTRAAAKATASDVAYHLGEIDGFKELNTGNATGFRGLTAPDATTLVVKMAIPDCEFDVRTFHTVFSPVPTVAGAGDNKAYNDQPIGNGPFKMDGPWQHNGKITLVRNDGYGLTKAHLDRVEISILNATNAAQLEYQGFQAAQFDWARMPTEQLTAAKATYNPKGDWYQWNANGMNYLLPMLANGPMKSKEAREAISYAIDRNAIVQGVFKGFYTAADSLIPPVFTDAYQKGVCASCAKQDKEKAKQLAAQAGLTPGTKLYFGYNTGAGHDAWVQAVAAQLKDVLGLDVQIDGKPFAQLLDKEKSPDATGIYRFAWGADYPTPGNFLNPLLATTSINEDPVTHKVQGDNRGRYSNPAFDALLHQATATKDLAARTKLYQQAEKIAIGDDLALIPLWNRSQQRVANNEKWANLTYDFNENPTLAKVSQK
ncbi:peptide ABC transporter substrate-binding protein [Kitasatospora sp. MMS16-BH015]|uniref:peptide ABC transporter substrate-binding protein n=1 Tax=Kitasatospora sp. MMS16-BH015 TaxID=2018025 RepID=UPI000CA12C53|nr:ABC transporter substrate-binding protein [Kitasatospora sp. MMS16-BH015]AUG75640.1 peptide ABC transporter substrate-binding protein [Kitasatospora sp. MMS16-BH015]